MRERVVVDRWMTSYFHAAAGLDVRRFGDSIRVFGVTGSAGLAPLGDAVLLGAWGGLHAGGVRYAQGGLFLSVSSDLGQGHWGASGRVALDGTTGGTPVADRFALGDGDTGARQGAALLRPSGPLTLSSDLRHLRLQGGLEVTRWLIKLPLPVGVAAFWEAGRMDAFLASRSGRGAWAAGIGLRLREPGGDVLRVDVAQTSSQALRIGVAWRLGPRDWGRP